MAFFIWQGGSTARDKLLARIIFRLQLEKPDTNKFLSY
jgi:hypothetical protein